MKSDSRGGRRHRMLPDRYKTEPCRNFNETGECRFGMRCVFAHGDVELRSRESNQEQGLAPRPQRRPTAATTAAATAQPTRGGSACATVAPAGDGAAVSGTVRHAPVPNPVATIARRLQSCASATSDTGNSDSALNGSARSGRGGPRSSPRGRSWSHAGRVPDPNVEEEKAQAARRRSSVEVRPFARQPRFPGFQPDAYPSAPRTAPKPRSSAASSVQRHVAHGAVPPPPPPSVPLQPQQPPQQQAELSETDGLPRPIVHDPYHPRPLSRP